MSNISENVLAAVKQASPDNTLSCTLARKLANDLQVPVKVIGEAAEQLNIKLKACELGCF